MMSQEMDRRRRGWMPLISLTFLLLLWASATCAQDNFNCRNGALVLKAKDSTTAAIIPRGDIEVKVGGPPTEVFCRFNSSLLNADDVYFTTKEGLIDYQIVNASTIKASISHTETQRYILYCKLKRTNKDKDKKLCSKTVMAGELPMDITNLNCRADDNLTLNCTWTVPVNPIKTTYQKPKYIVKSYLLTDCPKTNEEYPFTFCYWDKSSRTLLRDGLELNISGSNAFGNKSYSHHVDIMNVVYISKLKAQVILLNSTRVKVMWNLTYPVDVLQTGIWHNVEYRLASSNMWNNVTYFFHKNSYKTLATRRFFDVEETLPYANTDYEFRVRAHSGYSERTKDLWSPYDLLKIKTGKEVPAMAPTTSISTFETDEILKSRNIYVYFQDIDSLYHGGDHFGYEVKVFSEDKVSHLKKQPDERTAAFFKYNGMNYSSYRFEITPVNEKGIASVHSQVIVHKSDCLPKKTQMLTIITKSTKKENKKTFSLYWIPSIEATDHCAGASPKINSYTIFWCKKTNGDRCRTKLYWREVTDLDLVVKDLSEYTSANITIYEKNITDLDLDMIYSFGIAANNGLYSRGIKWASCIVDDTESPNPPHNIGVSADVQEPTKAIIKWALKCPQISAVPLGYKVSYCKSETADFGHCRKEVVEQTVINSPSASNVTIRNLDAGYSYIFAVSILSLIGEGKQSIPKMIKLGDFIPNGAPTNFVINKTETTKSKVSLSWSPPLVEKRRGRITEYKIQITESDSSSSSSFRSKEVTVSATNDEPGTKKHAIVEDLSPFTKYKISIVSCTYAGCAGNYPAVENVTTKTASPTVVKDFEIDVSNWRLIWARERCGSKECFYEITSNQIVNGTKFNTTISGEKYLQLNDEGLECNYTEMTFKIREIGMKEDGTFFYGNATQVTKEADLCPSDWLTWWALFLIIVFGFLVASLLFIAGKFGYGNIRDIFKECYLTINLPKGIAAVAEESNQDTGIQRKEYPAELMNIRRTSEPSLLLLHPDNCQINSFPHDDKLLRQLTRSSVSSEEVNLIDVDADRHGRNLSGSSEHSSAQDSAIMSGSPSVIDTDHDAMSAELGHNLLRLRCPGPAYVQQGEMLEKLSEGYVTAHSVPSLPHLYKDGYNSSQQSTPNLNGALQLSSWQNARRASTGYISMPDSELESPNRKDPIPLPRVPVSRIPGLPPYSRHSFNPNMKPELIKAVSPITGLQVGYVTIAGTRSPSPPTSGYVSAGDPLKRPYSLPLIGNSAASPGYVSAGPADNRSIPIQNNNTPVSKNPYVTYGEAAMMSVGRPDISGTISPYVELSDVGRWALPTNQLPALASAPVENGRIVRMGQMPRPNTTEATIGHRRTNGSPTLSKQSSGYVSQETIHHCDSVLMSPKRLLSQSAVPHSILMSPSHQASMV